MARHHVFRIGPGQDVLHELKVRVHELGIKSGLVLGIIGSLSEAELGFIKEPPMYGSECYDGPLEIVCAQGNIAHDVSGGGVICHVHMLISRPDMVAGGHLVSGKVFTTAEVALLEFTGGEEPDIKRTLDPRTSLLEIRE